MSYIADRDVIDSLKLDISSLSPVEDRDVSDATEIFMASINKKYREYIPEETLHNVEKLPERVIVVRKGRFESLHKSWSETFTTGLKKESYIESDGVYLVIGNFILIKHPKNLSYFWGLLSEANKKEWIDVYGNEKQAKEQVNLEHFNSVLLHEIIHGYNSTSTAINPDFLEDGTCYYTEEVGKEFDMYLFTTESQEYSERFKNLVDTHGRIIHEAFFGLLTDDSSIETINEFYQEVFSKENNTQV